MIFSDAYSRSRLKPYRWATVILAGTIMAGCSPATSPEVRRSHVSKFPQTAGRQMPENFPDFLADPFEPVNRGIGMANGGLILGVIRPTTRVYRAIVPPPARKSVTNFARNINYPGRLLNNVLQGRWQGAGDESVRFITNTTVGVGGLFDPATRWKIPKSDANFGQTFFKWGWNPNNYVMLPVLGPSDDLHTGGLLADKVPEPWNYYAPLSPLSAGIVFNRLSDQTEPIVQFMKTESDPYVGTKYFWSYASKETTPDWTTSGSKDLPTLQTLNVAAFRTDDPEFAIKAREASVRLSSTGKKTKFNYWLQKHQAPLVFVAPGIGSHRLSANTLAIAESLYQNGYSVVTTTGVFHPEFMETASTAALPAYPPVDCHDLLVYLTEINQSLEEKYPGMFGQRALVGFSLGGFQTLYLAAHEDSADAGLLRFDRYLAINTPVNLRYGDKELDAYYNAPLAWTSAQRQDKINNTLHKAALFPYLPPEQRADPPFDAIESKYLVGLSFRLVLRDTIYSSQYRNNMGVIKTPLNHWRREAAYDEILQYSFRDYFRYFVFPHYKGKGIDETDFSREVSLRSCQNGLRTNSRMRVIINQNDFLHGSSDISWLKSICGSKRLKVFPNGGHIGNLPSPPVRKAVLAALDGLK
jgi:ABC-type transporter lipoprotein component MlaA/pimeloyl-ACP methyl ester carboxylesterase